MIITAAPYGSFYERVPNVVADVLLSIGIPLDKVERELVAMNEVRLAKTNSRSILGSMKEFRFQLECDSDLGRLDQNSLEMSIDLADTISLVLPESTPKDTVRGLFGLEPDPRRKKRG